MKFIKKINNIFDALSTNRFYLYSGIFIGIMFLIHGFIIFNHYNSITYFKQQIEDANNLREEEIQKLLTRTEHVRKQQEEFDTLLAQDPNFKLGDYVEKLISELGLNSNIETMSKTQTEREEKYREEIRVLKLTNINMQQLAELLEKIENEPRINIKSIEITKSKKKPNTIEVLLTIAALQQK